MGLITDFYAILFGGGYVTSKLLKEHAANKRFERFAEKHKHDLDAVCASSDEHGYVNFIINKNVREMFITEFSTLVYIYFPEFKKYLSYFDIKYEFYGAKKYLAENIISIAKYGKVCDALIGTITDCNVPIEACKLYATWAEKKLFESTGVDVSITCKVVGNNALSVDCKINC